MGQLVYVFALLFIVGVISPSCADQYQEKHVKKSSLILEYNWPEPSKSLNRLPHPRSCHHFIHTKRDGSHIIKRCHGDKMFDYRSLRCQNKSSAKCWMNIIMKGNMKKIKRPFSCPFPWGLYPDKEDCSLFYDCMGGKVFPRKCPDSTLFDAVERICVHSRKALCARDSGINTRDKTTAEQVLFDTVAGKSKTSNADISIIATKTAPKSPETFGIDSQKSNSEEENSSEEVSKKYRTKSKNKFITSKSPFLSTRTVNSKLSKTTEVDSEENSSEEVRSTKRKNKFATSTSSLLSTSSVNSKSFKTTNADSKEDSSEEKNSSEEKGNKISSKYKLKLTTPKVRISSDNNYNKDITKEKIPITTIESTEDRHVKPSSELLFQSSTIKPLVSTENESKPVKIATTPGVSEKIYWSTEGISKELTSSAEPSKQDSLKPVKTTVTPAVSEKDNNINDDTKKSSWSTEILSTKHISSVESFSHKNVDPTTKIPFSSDSSPINPKTTENIQTGAQSDATTFNILCPDFDGYFPHPKDKHLFIACIAGKPTVMKCPENLVYDYRTSSCDYDKI